MTARNATLDELSLTQKAILDSMLEIKLFLSQKAVGDKSDILSIDKTLNELRQYIEADFEVVSLRFDRIEDRFDRLDSGSVYEH